jgi:hypothetical protein
MIGVAMASDNSELKELTVRLDISVTAVTKINVPSGLTDSDLDDFIFEEISKQFKRQIRNRLLNVPGLDVRHVTLESTEY